MIAKTSIPESLRLRVSLMFADNPKTKAIFRIVMFILAAAIACPIRYWPIADDYDSSCVFGLNYAAAQGLAHGRDLVFNTGPLGHLVFAQDVGDNLVHAIQFQALIWAVITGILWDLYFRVGVPLRNLCLFTAFFGLAAPLFWFNRVGLDNLLLAGVLVYLAVYRWRGGTWRLLVALALIGLMPLIKLTSGVIAAGALIGFLAEQIIQKGWNTWRDAVLVAVVPSLVAGIGFYLTIPSFSDFTTFVKASLEFSSEYSSAMSYAGPGIEIFAAIETVALLVALLLFQTRVSQVSSLFWAVMLAIPIAISFKHGFVRQDSHIINFFCFCALALALISLSSYLHGWRLAATAAVFVPFMIIWQERVVDKTGLRSTAEIVTGVRGLQLAWNARNLSALKASLLAEAERHYDPNQRIEREVREVIGENEVTSMSLTFSGPVVLDKLRLVLYPLIARSGAFTPYLDGLCAAWVREKGPRFIIFDGGSIDDRHPWTETPAMWLEVYRWYNTRLLGKRNLLLERRPEPRFSRLASIGRSKVRLNAGFSVPPSQGAVFWSMSCNLSREGKLRKLFFRLPPLTMQVQDPEGNRRHFRVIEEVLANPSLGNLLPADLPQFADVFGMDAHSKQAVQHLSFGLFSDSEGLAVGEMRSYEPDCEVEFYRPAN